jgi:ATP-binding cassette subfamily B protein
MLLTSPVLAVIAVLPLIPLGIRAISFARFVEIEWRKVMERLSNLGDHLQENLVGAEVVRAFAREGFEIDKFSAENQELYNQQLKVIDKWSSFLPFSAIMTASSIALTLIFGGLFERNGSFGVTVGVIVQFNAYILLMSQPIRFSGFVIMLITQGIASARRVFEVIDEPLMLGDKPGAYELPIIQNKLCFENVDFHYTGDNHQDVLHEVSLTAQPDDVIAVVGKTGSGKSTLVNLIPRFYDVTSGRITMDGHDIRAVTLESLRNQIGVVMQESLLFSATIRENIAFGRPNADEARIIAAAKAANAHDFILEYPDGYDTPVGERGVTLSGGQRQRVAIARALVMDPRILILDDSTSSVDTHTEHDIQAALESLMAGRITFIVAQRLTSVMHATQILVLDGGRIVERGTHDDLLEQAGVYKEIYDLQLADQERVRRETLVYDHRDFSFLD